MVERRKVDVGHRVTRLRLGRSGEQSVCRLGQVDVPAKSPLPTEVADRIGPYYVYVLVDPRTDRIFYVGKGTGDRLLQHGREADLLADSQRQSDKVRLIRELRALGVEPRHDVVRHGLPEPEALLVEAALIDCLTGLTNRVAGHGIVGGRQTMAEYVSRYGAEPVGADAPPALLIRLSRWRDLAEEIEPDIWRAGNGYRPGMSENDLFDSTRAWWKLSPASVDRRGVEYAVAVHEGVTRGVMRIGDWIQREDGRRAFAAIPVDDASITEQWIGPLGRRVEFTAAAQNPISYWPRQ